MASASDTVGDGGYVTVFISSNVSSFTSQKRYPSCTTIGDLKGKLELITGASAVSVHLQLFDSNQKLVGDLSDDLATLSSCGVGNDMRIHVTDSDPGRSKGEFEDLSKVEKYVMSDEDYAKRSESLRAFKQQMKLGTSKEDEVSKEEIRREEEEAASNISVGSRCEVYGPGLPAKRGTVKYVGETQFKPGLWVGIQYDEPLGKNDGSVKGQRYFTCPPNYGGFVKPKNVTVGDFPEESFSDDEM